MEKRAILAAVLMAALLIVYQFLFVKPPEPQRAAQDRPDTAARPAQPSAPVPAASEAAAPPPKEAPVVPERRAVVDTPLYHAVVESTGGRLVAWDLHYRGEKPMIIPGELGP